MAIPITNVILDDKALPRQNAFGLELDAMMMDGAEPAAQPEGNQKDSRIYWYQVNPNPIPPGKVAEIAVKWAFAHAQSIQLCAETSTGERYCGEHSAATNPLRITTIGFGADFDWIYLYVVNEGTHSIRPESVFMDSEETTAFVYPPPPSVPLESGQKRCFVYPAPANLRRGEYVTVKITAEDGQIAESTVRVFNEFPIIPYTTEDYLDDSMDGDLKMHDFPASEVQKKDLIEVLTCPTHLYGTFQEAGRKFVRLMTQERLQYPEIPGFGYICRAAQKEGAYAFGEIPDFIVSNLCTSSKDGPLDSLPHPTQRMAEVMKEAASPSPFMHLTWAYRDARFPEFRERNMTVEEMRLYVYYALSRGARGLFYGLAPLPEDRIGFQRLNGEIKAVRRFLAVGEPCGLGQTNDPKVEAATIQAGYEALVILLINHDHISRPAGELPVFEFVPKKDIQVEVRIPEYFGAIESLKEVEDEFKAKAVDFERSGDRVAFSVPELDLTRLFLITAESPY